MKLHIMPILLSKLEGKYGVRVEDLVLVTEDGHELLNAVDKKYRIVG